MIVFVSKIDGKFDLKVERVAPYRGRLTITDGDQTVYEAPVTLSYDARFGADVGDVRDWEQIAIEHVDQWVRRESC